MNFRPLRFTAPAAVLMDFGARALVSEIYEVLSSRVDRDSFVFGRLVGFLPRSFSARAETFFLLSGSLGLSQRILPIEREVERELQSLSLGQSQFL